MPSNEYSSIAISETGYNSKFRRKQSCWRSWNQLSSLQRSLLLVVLICSSLVAVYFLPPLYEAYMKLKPKEQPTKERVRQDPFADPDPPLQDPVMKRDSTRDKVPGIVIPPLVVRPTKRGPPALKHRQNDGVTGETPLESRDNEGAPSETDSHAAGEGEPPDSDDSVGPLTFTGPQNERQRAVVAAFNHAWSAYKKYAWGQDELVPLSKSYSTWFGVGLTLIDSLDTLYIMGLRDEFAEARAWVATSLNLDIDKDANLFEVTIRVLGGLLSAYHLSADKLFLDKAIDLANRLMPAFDSQSHVPYSDVNLKTHKAHAPRWGPDSSTSEVTTIQLEFRDLSRVTGDARYERAVDAVSDHVHGLAKTDGLVPIFISAQTGEFRRSAPITLGARGDSYYEYLLKSWLQTGKTRPELRADYEAAVHGMETRLMKESEPSKLMYFGELLGGHTFSPKMDHLVCYLGGALALGAHHGLPSSHLTLGTRLTRTCWETYRRMATGLAPEITHFNQVPGAPEDLIVKAADSHNLLRPETVESLFYLWRLTGDQQYRDWGWRIFNAFEKHTKLTEGYTSINNVKNALNPGFKNKMESFFLGETLKYFYLLFEDDPNVLSLDKYVFNTEAHPLPIYKS